MPTEPQSPTPQETEACLEQLHRAIDEYNELRDRTDRLARRRFERSPELAKLVIEGRRDAQKEREAYGELRHLMQRCEQARTDGRRGSSALTTEGLSDLGILPLIAVAGGALATTGLFSYLTEHERRLQAEITGESQTPLLERLGIRLPSGAMGGLLKLAVVAVVAYVAWSWWQSRQSRSSPAPRLPPAELDELDETQEQS